MIKKIVVPLDGSPLAVRALTPARALAERLAASLLLMTTHWDDALGEAQEYLENEAAKLGFDRVETLIVHDRFAAEAILLQAREPEAVVCMSTHGRSGLGQVVLGSIAEAVLREADRPLLLVGPALDPAAWQSAHWFVNARILVAIDGSEASETIVPVAAEWAGLLGLGLSVTQVFLTPVGLTPSHTDTVQERAALRRLAEGLPDAGGAPEWEVLHGPDVAASLLDYAGRLPAALVAMTTHGRTGLARVALGSVAMQVVHRSPCPVLVLRAPRGSGESTRDR